MPTQLQIFNNTNQATIQAQVNAFLAPLQPAKIVKIHSVAFQRGALTNFVVYIYYLT